MSMYRVIISKDVIKKFEENPETRSEKEACRILEALEENPFPKPFDVKPVKDEKSKGTNTYRLRIGDCRMFYTVYWDENLIAVTDIEPREFPTKVFKYSGYN